MQLITLIIGLFFSIMVHAQVTISSITQPSNGTYTIAQNIDYQINFTAPVFVTGSPKVKVIIGSANKIATYVSGSGTSTLTFRYTVLGGFSSTTGVGIISPIQLNGGTIVDGNGATPTLTFKNLWGFNILVSSSLPRVVSIQGPASPQAYYSVGQTVDFTVNFSEPMTEIRGASRIRLNIGGTYWPALYLSGSGTSTFIYRYTVLANHVDSDGVTVADIQMRNLVMSVEGAKIDTNFTPISTSVIVDALLPKINSHTRPADGYYIVGDTLNFSFTYNRPVNVSGSPKISMLLGDNTSGNSQSRVYGTYVSGSGTTTLNFSYTVQSVDLDLVDGVYFEYYITALPGEIVDLAGNDASYRGGMGLVFANTPTSAVYLDGTPNPTISSVTAPADATYKTGQTLDFQVLFSKSVIVTGTPRLSITTAQGTVVYANYLSGSNSTTLTFRYTVASGIYDTDGISVAAVISLNSGTIKDSHNNSAVLTFTSPTTTGVLVDGITPSIVSITAPVNGTYTTAQNINFIVNFNNTTNITGTPRIQLTVGASTLYANYLSGTGTNSQVYQYTVATGNTDSNGIDTVGPSIGLNGGTIKDVFGDDATITFTATNYPSVKVDTAAPTISSVTGPSAGTYGLGSSVNFIVNGSEALYVTGTPRIALTIGATTRYATYASGSGTAALTFTYSPTWGDTDSNGIASTSPLQLNSGTIKDLAGNSLSVLTFTPPTTTTVNIVTITAISSVTAPAASTYKTGTTLNFTATFNNAVDITGTPRIPLTVGASTLYANYLSGTGTTSIIFQYTVGAGDSDSNGIAVTGPVALNGGTINDLYGNAATITFTPPTTTTVLVDGIDLAIQSITPPADGYYKLATAMDFTVNYNYPAIVTGTPRIQLTIGASTVYATYVSGTNTSALVFRYTVAAGNSDTDGIDTVGPLQLNAGTIKDAYGDAASLTFTSTNYPGKLVDGIVPAISSMTVSTNRTYILNENIDFTATFSESVTVTGSPRLTLTVGATTFYATYLSGSNSNTLIFRYTIAAGASDTNGIAVSTTLALNGGTIVDVASNALSPLTFVAPTLTGVRVDGVAPTVSSFTAPTNATYGIGAAMNFTATFSEAVTVTGTPSLTLDIGGIQKNATYVSGTGTTAIVFRYTVATGDLDSDGVSRVSPLVLNGGTITDTPGNNATLSFTAGTHASVKVDGVAPTLSSVTPPASNTYKSGLRPTISFTVTYNENITVVGTPRIQLTVGSTTKYATYASGTGTANLVFNLTVATTDLDLDGIDVINSNNIDLNGGTLKDAGGNTAPVYMGSISTSNVYAVLSTMSSWYDISDSATLSYNGFNVIGISDKIGTYTLTHTDPAGVVYIATNFNSGTSAYVTCVSSGSFNGASATTPRAIIGVYRSPPNATSQYLYYSAAATNPKVQFSSTASSGTVSFGSTGAKYSAGAWGTAAATTTNAWSVDAAATRGFSWGATSNNKISSVCKMDGELAEMFFFSSVPTVAQMTVFNTYLSNRYSLSFP